MSHLRAKLRKWDLVCRKDDPRHIGVVIQIFKWRRYDEWTANIQWLDNNWREYVPMNDLIHAEVEETELKLILWRFNHGTPHHKAFSKYSESS